MLIKLHVSATKFLAFTYKYKLFTDYNNKSVLPDELYG